MVIGCEWIVCFGPNLCCVRRQAHLRNHSCRIYPSCRFLGYHPKSDHRRQGVCRTVINSSAVVTQLATTATPNLFSRNPIELVVMAAAACPHSLAAFHFVETTILELSMWWCEQFHWWRRTRCSGCARWDFFRRRCPTLFLRATTYCWRYLLLLPRLLHLLAADLLFFHRIQPCQAQSVRQWKIRERATSPPSLYQHAPLSNCSP